MSLYDLEQFYSEQVHRMECLGHDVVMLKDIVCQGLDMVRGPSSSRMYLTRMDLRKSKLSGDFFNIMFNINKFYSQEQRDSFRIRRRT